MQNRETVRVPFSPRGKGWWRVSFYIITRCKQNITHGAVDKLLQIYLYISPDNEFHVHAIRARITMLFALYRIFHISLMNASEMNVIMEYFVYECMSLTWVIIKKIVEKTYNFC